MDNIKKVKQQAIEVKKILDKYFDDFSDNEIQFRAAFHLRPTSSGDTTILSTLPIAPMRGISVKNDKLMARLTELRQVLNEPDDGKRLKLLKDMGFKKRRSVSQREEDAQAFLIRELILNPKEYNHMQFVASEFDLFDYGEKKDEVKRPDVIVYKDGILYDIE